MRSELPWEVIRLKRSIRIISANGSEVCKIALSAYVDNTRHIDDANFIVEQANKEFKS